jgi:hypothetical protein
MDWPSIVLASPTFELPRPVSCQQHDLLTRRAAVILVLACDVLRYTKICLVIPASEDIENCMCRSLDSRTVALHPYMLVH